MLKIDDRVSIFFRTLVEIVTVESVDDEKAIAGEYSLDLDNYRSASKTNSHLAYTWELATPEDEDYFESVQRDKADKHKREQDFESREDVRLARRIAAMCNGDVGPESTCKLLDLGIDKLKQIVAIIDAENH
jgi:hypothetical protein